MPSRVSTHFNAAETAKHTLDAMSIGVVLGTLADILPAIAALFTIVWTAVRIYETRTVQRWVGRVIEERPSE